MVGSIPLPRLGRGVAERFTALGPVVIRRLRTARPDLVVPWPPAPSGVTLGEGVRMKYPYV
jgi:hypothetical protein